MLFWHRDLDCNRQVISNDVHDKRIKKHWWSAHYVGTLAYMVCRAEYFSLVQNCKCTHPKVQDSICCDEAQHAIFSEAWDFEYFQTSEVVVVVILCH